MIDDLERITKLWKDGALTDEEFEAQKAKILLGDGSDLEGAAVDQNWDDCEEPKRSKVPLYGAWAFILIATGVAGVLAYDYAINDKKIITSLETNEKEEGGSEVSEIADKVEDIELSSSQDLPSLEDDAHAARMCMVSARRHMGKAGETFDNLVLTMYYTSLAAHYDRSGSQPFMQKLNSLSRNELLSEASRRSVPDDRNEEFLESCESKFPKSKKDSEYGIPSSNQLEFRFSCFAAMGVLKEVSEAAGDAYLADKYVRMSERIKMENAEGWASIYDISTPEKVSRKMDESLRVTMPNSRLDVLAAACEEDAA